MLLAAAAGNAMRTGTERITEEIIDRCNYMPHPLENSGSLLANVAII
jgi:hypothetical protein